MPNWVTNILTVEDVSEEKRREIFEAIKDDKEGYGSIDFNKIIPMPESLNIHDGSDKDYAITIYLTERLTLDPNDVGLENYISNRFSPNWAEEIIERIKTRDFVNKRMDELYEMGKQYIFNIVNYGYATWYDWCIENWDTKWNASSSCVGEENQDITFETAWSTPESVIRALSKLFPNIVFKVRFADEDFGYNVGEYSYHNGILIESYEPVGGSDEAMDMAAEIRGYDPREDEYWEE